jgi:hypothetical protein
VIANQLSATVWPYLDFNRSQSDTAITYSIANRGLGPAIVKSAELTYDGKRYTSFFRVLLAIEKTFPRHTSSSSTSIGAGTVLRPNAELDLFVYRGPGARALAERWRMRGKLAVCYCSLLGQCWTLSSSDLETSPEPAGACPNPSTVDA